MNGETRPQPKELEEVALISGHLTMNGRNEYQDEKILIIHPEIPITKF